MRTFLSFTILLLFISSAFGQNMTNSKMEEIITSKADSINGQSGNWQFIYEQVPMFCITNEAHNRMRIISPIASVKDLSDNLLRDSLIANFHTALDVKYAISQDVLWSVFIHPLQELSTAQVEDAISQVRLAALTFGSTFTSTELLFGGGNATRPVKNTDTTKIGKTHRF
ncbi:hypothetical protein NBT05_14010 [Aquimarina sp. ERC-38]|uniref:hypothetical protein n=1 Tax=Aquimarina sp. ERC-38 TaxID=2949996 RepID=UPI002247A329|nr:hypothetical protein [Aquimarina sp. ERC-38]UZO80056.1 hypothetical protein NBT05_14010 [Aquimarina sp. ERC-38]